MEIKTSRQYNQGIGKYKVLSSNAGVGAIVATKWGGFIMPKSSTDWGFVYAVSEYLKSHPTDVPDYKNIASETGTEIIEDNRFVGFLKETEGMTNLKCLVAIPHISLNQNNVCEVKDHPINIRYRELHPTSEGLKESTFTVPAVVFPRWFYSRQKSDFRPIEEWARIWRELGCNGGDMKYFAPPRDPYMKTNRKQYDDHLPDGRNMVHGLLEQVSMVLICPNGHISDIPWRRYFAAKLELGSQRVNEEGFDLFNYDGEPCPNSRSGEHELQWLENRNHSESFGTLKCKCCGKSVSLEGIMNLQPLCHGDKPWEGIGKRDFAPCRQKPSNKPSTMKWAMVTSNSVYYAESFSSLFIPDCYHKGDSYLDDKQQKVLKLMEEKWFNKYLQKHPGASREEYIDDNDIETLIEKADDSDYTISEEEMTKIVNVFLGVGQDNLTTDVREKYRYDEYEVFQSNSQSLDNDKLRFADIELPNSLKPYFSKIQQVSTLGVSSTQINFSRVSMPQPQLNDDGSVEYPNRMKIFRDAPEEVLVMPANQSFGEGLFFSLSEEALVEWESRHHDELAKHYASTEHHDDTYENVYQKMKKGGISRFFLLHTFSHAIMKELEFSCGYPTASLSERLYFSDRMCGVLIYTADGAEGSMGGLVWQGQPRLIEDIIRKAMQRALNCASDPICWENDDQMNFAACFSCSMVSETSCEERNVGLDRRALVDENYGFFKNLLQ